ncbi:pentatricopeptide repeat-containing protein At4g21300 isoform X1 [Dendrobium catenatum]|uniref:pentatricopeptide repeat-containing protein At4g21300 isoform X1 n=3 Tax=Dendrobium catenatum TaxID=906689 RepID=UPI0009F6909D|nr:pentatricopeptide repeat-containing protein At4g21300 isoform X1 [Dendrobium catenatum]
MNGCSLNFIRKRVSVLAPSAHNLILKNSSLSAFNVVDTPEAHKISSGHLASRFLLILRSLRDPSDLQKGRQVHAQVVSNGLFDDNLLGSTVLGMYVLCRSISDAKSLFFCMEKDSTLLWNWMIRGFSMMCMFEFSLLFYFKMLCAGIFPDKYTFPYVIKSCCGLSAIGLGNHIHKMICQVGMEKDVFVGSSLIKMHADNGYIEEARKVFDRMPERDCVLWNVMMDGYVRVGDANNALEIFEWMMSSGSRPNYVTFSCVLSLCASQAILSYGTLIHGLALKYGLDLEISVANTLLAMYSKFRCLSDVNMLFNMMPKADLVTWNGMISGFVQNGLRDEALELFYKMQDAGIKPDSITLASFLPSFSDSANLKQGKEIHAYILRNNVCLDLFLKSALIDIYCKCKEVGLANKVFNMTGTMDVAICSAMISGYILNGLSSDALLMFRRLLKAEIKPNAITLASILPACACLTALTLGKELHGYVLKNSFEGRCYVASSLIDMYAKCGRLDIAHQIFRKISEKDTVAWNSMIANFNQNGQPEEVFNLFCQMSSEGIKYDAVTISSMLSACASLPALNYGKEIHGFMIRGAFTTDLYAESCLIDMYAKCGELNIARCVFDSMIEKNEVSWNSIIAAYGAHGLLNDAVSLFQEMEKGGYLPDHITFLTLISACSHTGQIEEGFQFFSRMKDYGIVARNEHYSCMVDLYARAGKLHEAFQFISNMPWKPDAGIWGALLGACQVHRNPELAELASKHLFELDPQNSGYYILMSNVHAVTGQWAGVVKVRSLMKERNVQKLPGCSWFEINNTTHMFVSGGGKSHPDFQSIHFLLKLLIFELKEAGYVPNPDCMYQLDTYSRKQLSI